MLLNNQLIEWLICFSSSINEFQCTDLIIIIMNIRRLFMTNIDTFIDTTTNNNKIYLIPLSQ